MRIKALPARMAVFCSGGMFVAALYALLQDHMGKERFLAFAAARWVSYPWAVWLPVLLVALYFGFVHVYWTRAN